MLLPDAAARGRLQAGLRDAGVPTAVYYPRALHQQPAYAGHHDGSALPVSEDLATRILALPIHPDLSEADAERVCDAVRATLAGQDCSCPREKEHGQHAEGSDGRGHTG